MDRWRQNAYGDMRVFDDGKYVLYTDHLAAIAEKDAEIEALHKIINSKEDGDGKED